MKKKTSDFDSALSEDDLRNDEDWIIRIGFLIHDCARLRRIILDEKFKPLNITRSQAWLMAYLSRSDGVSQSVLAEEMGIGKVGLGGLVDRLEANELIERRSDLEDRRVNKVFLTNKGRKVVIDMRALTLEANDDILKGIGISKVKSGARVLGQLKKNLQQMLNDD